MCYFLEQLQKTVMYFLHFFIFMIINSCRSNDEDLFVLSILSIISPLPLYFLISLSTKIFFFCSETIYTFHDVLHNLH